MVIVDTNIIIDHLRRPARDSKLIRVVEQFPDERLGLSLISIQELYEGRSTKNEDAEKSLLSTLAKIEILPYSYEVASVAGKIARDFTKPIDLADAAIAATCLVQGARLFTLNQKDFLGIEKLEFLTL